MKKLVFLGILSFTIISKAVIAAQIEIVLAQTEDLPQCAAICTSPKNSVHIFPEFNISQLYTYLATAQKSSRYTFFVAKKDNTVTGLAVCFKRVPAEWNLDILAVHEQHRRQGIGSCLLKKMQALSQIFQTPVSLMVQQSNQTAIDMYQKQQFHLIKKYGDDPDSYQEHQFNPKKSKIIEKK